MTDLLIWLAAALSYSLKILLWHDELFTFYLAEATTALGMLLQTQSLDYAGRDNGPTKTLIF